MSEVRATIDQNNYQYSNRVVTMQNRADTHRREVANCIISVTNFLYQRDPTPAVQVKEK